MLRGIRKLYNRYKFYETVFASLLISVSVLVIIHIVILLLPYLPILGETVYLGIFLILFFALFCAFNLFEISIGLTRQEGILLACGVVLSIMLIYVIL